MRIKDSGVGIPTSVLDRIFDPYFSTKQEGSGLGLAITHSIVTKHGGHISVQSSPGEGTTFTIYLPASEQSLISVKEEEKQTQSAKKSTILVMDDEEQVRNIIEAMLGQLGHSVVLAKDGSETIRIFKEAMESDTPVDLIIMDLTIPGGMGGRETVQKILEIDSEAKAIVASGYSNDPVMANFEDYGFCGSLVKPFQLVELQKVVSEHIG
jgi:CheY-like chemotaxis protein